MSGLGVRMRVEVSADLPTYHINPSWGYCVVKGVQREIPPAGSWVQIT